MEVSRYRGKDELCSLCCLVKGKSLHLSRLQCFRLHVSKFPSNFWSEFHVNRITFTWGENLPSVSFSCSLGTFCPLPLWHLHSPHPHHTAFASRVLQVFPLGLLPKVSLPSSWIFPPPAICLGPAFHSLWAQLSLKNLINLAAPVGNWEFICYPEERHLHFNKIRSGDDDVLIHLSISTLIAVYHDTWSCTWLSSLTATFLGIKPQVLSFCVWCLAPFLRAFSQ